MKIFKFTLILALALLVSLCGAQTSQGYHLAKKILIGGEGGWDYLSVDAGARRLYVSHSDHVVVVNIDSNTIVGEIPKTEGVHGVAVAPEFGHGFSSNGKTSTVTMFDLKTLDTIKEIAVGKRPDAIIYDPAAKNIFTCNGGSDDATAVNAESGVVAGTVSLGGRPEFAAADGQGYIYINLENKNEIVAVDSRTLTATAHWPIAPGDSPSGLAIDAEHHLLFSGCHNDTMIVLSTETGKVVAALPIGKGVDACAFDAGTECAFASCGDGTITVVHENSPTTFSVVETIATQRGARTMALDPATHAVFTATAEFGPAPAPTPEHPRTRPTIIQNTFTVLRFEK